MIFVMLVFATVVAVLVIFDNRIFQYQELLTMKDPRNGPSKYHLFLGLPFILSLFMIFSKKADLFKYKVYEALVPFYFEGCNDDGHSQCIWQAPPNMIILNYEKESEGLIQKKCKVNMNKYRVENFKEVLSIKEKANEIDTTISRKSAKAKSMSTTAIMKKHEYLSPHCATLVINYKGESRWSKASGNVKVSYGRQ